MRVKLNIFRKYFLNFLSVKTTVENQTLTGHTQAKPYCSKFSKIRDSNIRDFPHLIACVTFQQLRLLSVKDGPRNLSTSKMNFLKQEWTLFSFLFTTVATISFFDVAGFLDSSLGCDTFFCGMSRVPWCMTKKITKYPRLFCLYIFEKFLRGRGRETYVTRPFL